MNRTEKVIWWGPWQAATVEMHLSRGWQEMMLDAALLPPQILSTH